MKYTIKELKHLRNIRAVGFDNCFADDKFGTDKYFFLCETETFFDWLEKMELKGKTKEMLQTLRINN